ncbi:MAG: DUF2334 domain-containing protein [Methanobacterium sp.]|jgi:predicted deacetylase
MITIHPWPNAKDMAFSIRDDDLSFFTDSKMLERIYNKAWENGFKVSFSTIPNHKGTNNLNVPPNFRNSHNYYPIYKNTQLVEFLKQKIVEDKIDIMQHGYCHMKNVNLPELKFDLKSSTIITKNNEKFDLNKYSEFYGANADYIRTNIKEGKTILEKTFEIPIKVFVAPQEYLNKNMWQELLNNNLSYCGSFGIRSLKNVPINQINFINMFKVVYKNLINNFEEINDNKMFLTNLLTIPSEYSHSWNISSNSEKEHFNYFKDSIHNKLKSRGFLILLTHYYEYYYDWNEKITQKNLYKYFIKSLNYVNNNLDLWKCSVTELVSWISRIKQIHLKQKHNELIITSRFKLPGFTIKIHDDIGVENKFNVLEKNSFKYVIMDIKVGENRIVINN